MATDGKSVRVKIFGSEYPLRGDDEDMTKRVALFVDEMIKTIHEKIPEQPPLTIAVLSALNITEDLFKEREGAREFLEVVESDVNRIQEILDRCLDIESTDVQ